MLSPSSAAFHLSPQQKLAWRLTKDPARSITQVAVDIKGNVDLPRLKASLQRVVDSHEILRTGFQRSPGMEFPFQVIAAAAPQVWDEGEGTAGSTIRAALHSLGENHYQLALRLNSLCADVTGLHNLVAQMVL